jgi:hypothetical protein
MEFRKFFGAKVCLKSFPPFRPTWFASQLQHRASPCQEPKPWGRKNHGTVRPGAFGADHGLGLVDVSMNKIRQRRSREELKEVDALVERLCDFIRSTT